MRQLLPNAADKGQIAQQRIPVFTQRHRRAGKGADGDDGVGGFWAGQHQFYIAQHAAGGIIAQDEMPPVARVDAHLGRAIQHNMKIRRVVALTQHGFARLILLHPAAGQGARIQTIAAQGRARRGG